MDDLKAGMSGPGAVRCYVLSGMAGAGKTELAVRYARSQWRARIVDLLVWITATSRVDIVAAYAEAAVAIGVAGDADPVTTAKRFLTWLETTSRSWLLVLDDMADTAHLDGLWPPRSDCGQVLVTTRRRDAILARGGRRLGIVGPFTHPEAEAYLTSNLAAYGKTDDPAQIASLASELGCLPLALSHAATSLADSTLDCQAFRERLIDRQRKLRQVFPDSGLPDEYSKTIAAALFESIDRANELTPKGVARPILELASMLDPNGIPEAILISGPARQYVAARRSADGQQGPVDGSAGLAQKADAKDALSCIYRLHLADIDETVPGHWVRVHSLNQRACRDGVPADMVAMLAGAASNALLAVWPEVERDQGEARALRSNAAVLAAQAGHELWVGRAHPVLFKAGQSLGESGLSAAAVSYWQDLVSQATRLLGADHPDTLTARHGLAYWQGEAGDPAAAAAATEDVLTDRRRVLGPDHPDTIEAQHNVARWRGEAGDAVGAAAATQEVLDNFIRLYGPDHSDTRAARNNLARWKFSAGDLAGAIALTEQVLADCLRLDGHAHHNTLLVRGNLACWHGEAGDAGRAVAELKPLVADCKRELGPDHATTNIMRNHLARWIGEAGDPRGAIVAFAGLLDDRTRIHGHEHPNTLLTRGNLARWQGEAGEPVAAAHAFEELLADCVQYLPPDHPITAKTRDHLAQWQEKADIQPEPVDARPAVEEPATNAGHPSDETAGTAFEP